MFKLKISFVNKEAFMGVGTQDPVNRITLHACYFFVAVQMKNVNIQTAICILVMQVNHVLLSPCILKVLS